MNLLVLGDRFLLRVTVVNKCVGHENGILFLGGESGLLRLRHPSHTCFHTNLKSITIMSTFWSITPDRSLCDFTLWYLFTDPGSMHPSTVISRARFSGTGAHEVLRVRINPPFVYSSSLHTHWILSLPPYVITNTCFRFENAVQDSHREMMQRIKSQWDWKPNIAHTTHTKCAKNRHFRYDWGNHSMAF